jgi:hypothetical protein
MPSAAFDIPVALIVFNRPRHTRLMLAEVAKARPKTLFVIADGPRRPDEGAAVAEVRDLVAAIDWPCDIRTNYSDTNLGCRRRISSGIDWVFSHIDRAIFLEDDCLPDPTFFPFCQQMLERYADDRRVMAVSGDNFQFGRQFNSYSYYFSAIPHCWGWATWKRAWAHNDVHMTGWPAAAATDFPIDFLPSEKVARHNRKLMGDVHAGRIDSWAIPWEFACWQRRGLTVLPNVNLVSNIGFGVGATHCHKPDPFANLPVTPIEFPLRHPPEVRHQVDADLAFYDRAIRAA